jgi:putative membrane protein
MGLARHALRAHVALSGFSAIAFATFLVPPIPEFFRRPTNQAIMDFSYRFGGQSTVVLGAIAAIAFLADAVGTRRTLQALAICFVLSFTAEAVGTVTGYPFGPYVYTERLGFLIAGLVPFNIPTSWFYLLVAGLGLCARLLPARDDGASKWWWAFVAALILTAWDLVMDPAMFRTEHWLWQLPDLRGAPAWQRLLGTDAYFGVPPANFLGWVLTGTLVARAMLAVIPPSDWVRQVGPHRFPWQLYAANGILPITICLRWGMAPAALAGIVAMGIPLALAWRAAPLAHRGEAAAATTAA